MTSYDTTKSPVSHVNNIDKLRRSVNSTVNPICDRKKGFVNESMVSEIRRMVNMEVIYRLLIDILS